MIRTRPESFEHTWNVGQFSTLPTEPGVSIRSPLFPDPSHTSNWYLELYPNGFKPTDDQGYLSIYLCLASQEIECPYVVNFVLSIVTISDDNNNNKNSNDDDDNKGIGRATRHHVTHTCDAVEFCFGLGNSSRWGFRKFLPRRTVLVWVCLFVYLFCRM